MKGDTLWFTHRGSRLTSPDQDSQGETHAELKPHLKPGAKHEESGKDKMGVYSSTETIWRSQESGNDLRLLTRIKDYKSVGAIVFEQKIISEPSDMSKEGAETNLLQASRYTSNSFPRIQFLDGAVPPIGIRMSLRPSILKILYYYRSCCVGK